MLQVMQDKRKATEAAIEEKKSAAPTGESIEERKARLAAQRDMLRKIKEEKRQQELAEFNNTLQ